MGRPIKKVDGDMVVRLAGLFCTQSEIAAVVGCSERTIRRRYAAEFERGQSLAKVSLRRAQWELARKGNAQMLRWLGIQLLGQRDRPADDQAGGSGDFVVDLSSPAE